MSSGAIVDWSWDFGDGSSDNVQNPSHLYTTTSTYDVSLTATTDNGCQHTVVIPVTVYPTPIADFSSTEVCETFAPDFTDISSVSGGAIVGWTWDFGDGTSADASQIPIHTYSSAGTYDVSLTVTSSDGCVSEVTHPVVVHANPVVTFLNNTSCEGVVTNFTDNTVVSGSNVVDWSWDFGDGAFDNIQDPSHLYANSGMYDVSLTTTSAEGCMGSATLSIEVFPNPIADFTTSSVCEGELTVFTDNTSISSGSIVDWSWDFGDGSGSVIQNPSHTYLSAGTHIISLEATSAEGCVGSTSRSVTVHPSPEMDFSVSITEGCAPLDVVFEDLSVVPGGGTIVDWTWAIDQDDFSYSQTAMYSFPSPGDYDVSLIAVSDKGCKMAMHVFSMIHVYDDPTADFLFTPQPTDVKHATIHFFDMSSFESSEWMWDFGDGNTGSAQYPSHTYADTGTYVVGLTVFNDQGCSDYIEYPVIIDPYSSVLLPSGFTPNGDGKNDVLTPIAFGNVEVVLFQVYNRWGHKLFESNGEGWNGTYDGKPQSQGVYTYIIEYISTKSLQEFQAKGTTTLIR